jgi:small GTP-binding protein
VVLLGDGGVGKTSLVKRFVYSKFDDEYIKTLGTNVYKKMVQLDMDENTKIETKLMVWDVMGQNIFPNVMKNYLKGAHGIILVCDLTNESSYVNLQEWIRAACDANETCSGTFLANKSDLPGHAFGISSLEALSNAFEAPYFVTSAKTGDNVEEAFRTISAMIYKGQHINREVALDIEKKVKDLPDIILAEDAIINIFCNNMGGYENAMPMVRQQFEQLKIDFEEPRWNQLEMLIQRLITVMQMVKTEDQIKKVLNEMRRYVKYEE